MDADEHNFYSEKEIASKCNVLPISIRSPNSRSLEERNSLLDNEFTASELGKRQLLMSDDLDPPRNDNEKKLIKLHAQPQKQKDVIPKHEIPRSYQTHLFDRAKDGNVIAVLDTGTGKTLIAVMLLKYMAALPGNESKCSIFLVPTVPLVGQQANYIKFNSSLRVVKFHGGMSQESVNDRQSWSELVTNADVIAITPNMFQNYLDHGNLNLEMISLIVFGIL